MAGLDVSFDTTAFEVPAELDGAGAMSERCAEHAIAMLDRHGFVIVTSLLSPEEADRGLELVRHTIDDPKRERSQFASETDTKNERRDFCPLPLTKDAMSFASLICRRLAPALLDYCGRDNPVLEISTLTSYVGSSHQYIHRDPPGVMCLFAALDDVSEEQGGTVFVPGTHRRRETEWYDSDGDDEHSKRVEQLFQTASNMRILRHNLANLRRWKKEGLVSTREFRQRVWSDSSDDHQPNLYRFLKGGHQVFDRTRYGARTLARMRRNRDEIRANLRLVQAAPGKGTVILYKSDMLHAGPENRSSKPRYFFNMNIARTMSISDVDRAGYAAHSTLVANPKRLRDFLEEC